MRVGFPKGYSLVEAIVVITIMSVIMAMVLPTLMGLLDRQRHANAAAQLQSLSDAIGRFERDLAQYPRDLRALADPIHAGDRRCDGRRFGRDAAEWRGPYVDRLIPLGGLPIGIGMIRNEIRTAPEAGHRLRLIVDEVSREDALAIDARVDRDPSRSAGTVRWLSRPESEGAVTLIWQTPHGPC